MSNYKLSEGVLETLMQGGQAENPIVQVLGCKKITSQEATDRYRLLLSDGKWMISFAMLASQINATLELDGLPNNTVIRITRHITSTLQNSGRADKKVLVILDLDIIADGNTVGCKIGDPKPLNNASSNGTSKTTTNESVSNGSTSSTTATTSGSSSFRQTSSSSTADTSIGGPQICHPIDSLTPYNSKWVIKARVVSKSGIRTWSNSRGTGKLFNMDLCDESSEIRATAFNDECDRFYDLLQVDKVYYVKGGMIKVANKNFNTLKHDYEISLGRDSSIVECFDSSTKIPTIQYNFKKILDLSTVEPQTTVDVIGVCLSATEITQFTSRAGKELTKREVKLGDQSGASILITLWGADAQQFDGTGHPIVAIKQARLGEYLGGKNLSMFQPAFYRINPDIPEAHELQGWLRHEDIESICTNDLSVRTGDGAVTSTPYMTFGEVVDKQMGNEINGEYFKVLASIFFIKVDNCVYKACPKEGCNKKVVPAEDENSYRCEKCGVDYPNFNYRLIMNMNLADYTTNCWVTCFTDEAEKILKKSSQEIGEMCEDKEQAAEYISSCHFQKKVFRCRVKMESFNDEARLKTVVLSSESIKYNEVNKKLIARIEELTDFSAESAEY